MLSDEEILKKRICDMSGEELKRFKEIFEKEGGSLHIAEIRGP